MPPLSYNQCLSLLIIAFIFAIIVVRLLKGVVNQAFNVIDYAKQEIYGAGAEGEKPFDLKQLVGVLLRPLAEQGAVWIKTQLLGGGKSPKVK